MVLPLMTIVLPTGWCDDGMDSQRHRYMRCLSTKTINGVPCQCTKRVRVSSNDVPHFHQYSLPTKASPCNTQALIIHYQNKIKKTVAKMIATTNLAASQAENPTLKEVVLISIKAGQEIPHLKPEDITPTINRHNIIPIINSTADEIQQQRLATFKNGFSSLNLDAGTLMHRHFLDFVLSPPILNQKPLLYDALEVTKLGIQEYGHSVLNVLEELYKSGVRIGSIVGDNHPIQKLALAHFSANSVLKTSDCDAVKSIRFFSCAAHTTSLMIEMAVNDSHSLSTFDSFLKGTICSINETPIKRIVGHCPTTVDTRWLSRIESIDWILKHEDQLKESINHAWIKDADQKTRSKAMQGINFQRFEALRTFAQVVYPFYTVIKYFESDSVTQAAVFPVTNSLLRHFESMKNDPLFEQFPDVIDCIINAINHYINNCYDWPLVTLSFFVTLEGRAWFLTEIAEKEFSTKWENFNRVKFDFIYKVSCEILEHNHNQEKDNNRSVNQEDDAVGSFLGELHDNMLQEVSFKEEEVAEPAMPPQKKISMYDDALESLISITEDLGLNKDEVPVQFSTWMFDPELDEFLWTNRYVPIIQIWQSLSGDDRIKTMRRSITRILSARATEACVEREFSREKLILGRLRSRMDDRLLKSRSILMESLV